MHILTIKEARLGSRNVTTSAVEKLLRSYGFESHKEKRLNWQHLDYSDLQLNIDPNRIDADPQAVKDAAHACEKVRERRKEAAANSTDTLPAWLNVPEDYSAACNQNTLILWSKETPELAMKMNLKANEQDSQIAYKQAYEQFSGNADFYKVKLTELSENYGFTVARDESECTISQADYGIARHLPVGRAGTSRNVVDILVSLEQEAKQIYDARLEKAIALEEHGFSVRMPGKDSNKIEIVGNGLNEPIYIPVSGKLDCIDAQGLLQIEGLLERYPRVSKEQFKKEESIAKAPETLPKDKDALLVINKPDINVSGGKSTGTQTVDAPVILYKAPDSVSAEHDSQTKEPVPMIETVAAQPSQTLAQYKDTFGYHVSLRRFERKLTEAELATQVLKIVGGGGAGNYPDLNAEKVMQWQMNIELPDEHVYLALRKILVDDNKAIPAKEKEAASQAFDTAYDNTRAFKEGYSHNQSDAYAFGQMMYQYRQKANLLDDAKLIRQLREGLRWEMDESQKAIDAKMMFNIMANEYIPSPGLARAIVKALDKSKKLSNEEHEQFIQAYNKVKPDPIKKIITQQKDNFADCAARDIIRRKMHEFFRTPEGKELTNQNIYVLSKGDVLTVPIIAEILGTNGIKPATTQVWEKRGEALISALQELGASSSDIREFEELYNHFVNGAPCKQSAAMKQ